VKPLLGCGNMRQKHHIVYIPGLADTGVNRISQGFALQVWQAIYGVSTQTIRVGWANAHDSFEAKLQRVVNAIDQAQSKGKVVSIVASSAGGSLAINAFAARPQAVQSVVTIAGAHGPVTHASKHTLARNPALGPSLVQQVQAIASLSAAARGAILVIKPAQDNVVQLRDMDIPGVHYSQLSTKGHAKAIAAALTKYSPRIIAFIKHAA
jgi:pimeloyl-ACP methyl ester carboxylesterase